MLRVKIVTPSVEAAIRPVEGIPGIDHVQAVEALVVAGDIVERHLCVNVFPGVLDDAARLALTQQLRAADATISICVLIETKGDETRLYRAPGQAGTAVGGAAAFACFQIVWGWDEHDPLRFQIGAQRVVLRVRPRDRDGWWPFVAE